MARERVGHFYRADVMRQQLITLQITVVSCVQEDDQILDSALTF